MSIKLDVKDRALLYALDTNARESGPQLAKRIGVSKDVVNYRLKRLESEGIINFYTTIIDMTRAGFQSIRVMLTLIDIPPKIEQQLIAFLTKTDEVFFVSQFKGSSDISFGYATRDLFAFQEYLKQLKSQYQTYIFNIEIAFYDELHHLHRKYLSPNAHPTIEIMGNRKQILVDTLDVSILKKLTENARIPTIEIARQLKKPVMTIVSRIRRLEKEKIILGYSVILSSHKLCMGYYKVELKLNNNNIKSKILEYCRQHKNIIYYMQSVGNQDVEFFVEIETVDKLLTMIAALREKCPEIRSWNYSTFMKYYKFNYL